MMHYHRQLLSLPGCLSLACASISPTENHQPLPFSLLKCLKKNASVCPSTSFILSWLCLSYQHRFKPEGLTEVYGWVSRLMPLKSHIQSFLSMCTRQRWRGLIHRPMFYWHTKRLLLSSRQYWLPLTYPPLHQTELSWLIQSRTQGFCMLKS